jgi:uncharacterized protein (DUF2141 family)
MKKALATAALFATSALLPLCSHAADITLEVEGLQSGAADGSMLRVGVFTDAGQWLNKPMIGRLFPVTAAVNGKLTVELKDVPDGPLAISLHHDANANGKMDTNPIGIPTEPYGFSNNAVGNFGPPRFEQAVFTPAAGAPVKVRMN